jgi:hypothetical protein
MGLLQLVRVNLGEVGILPGTVKMVTTDSLATITAAGYLNGVSNQLAIVKLSPSDVVECLYSFNQSAGSGQYSIFKVTITNGLVTLTPIADVPGTYLPLTGGTVTGQLIADNLIAGFNYSSIAGADTLPAPGVNGLGVTNRLFEFVAGTTLTDVNGVALYEDGSFFAIKNTSGATASFVPFGADNIDGVNAPLLIPAQSGVFMTKTGTQWSTIGSFSTSSVVTPAQVQKDAFNYAQDFGGVNAYNVALTPAVTSYASATGLYVDMLAISTNTGAATMNSGGGALPIHNQDGSPLAANAILNGGQYRLTINPALNAWILSNTSLPAVVVSSGIYTPTLTPFINVTSTGAGQFQYMRVGNVVTVSGALFIQAASAAAISVLIELPIPSNLASGTNCSGQSGSPPFTGYVPANISGDPFNDAAALQGIAGDTVNRAWYTSFTYLII